MKLSDTTNKNGLIQTFEFFTGLEEGTVTNDTTFKKQVVARINSAFDTIIPLILAYSQNELRFDDLNNTDKPIATLDIVSGQNDYKVTQDDNSLAILNIAEVRIQDSSSSSDYFALERVPFGSAEAFKVMSPDSSNDTGVPRKYLVHGNVIYLYPVPDYSKTNGMKIFFERQQSYFTASDDNKEPGIPKPFHELLALYAAYDWLLVNKPDNSMLISRLEARIARKEKDLKKEIAKRNYTRRFIIGERENAE